MQLLGYISFMDCFWQITVKKIKEREDNKAKWPFIYLHTVKLLSKCDWQSDLLISFNWLVFLLLELVSNFTFCSLFCIFFFTKNCFWINDFRITIDYHLSVSFFYCTLYCIWNCLIWYSYVNALGRFAFLRI